MTGGPTASLLLIVVRPRGLLREGSIRTQAVLTGMGAAVTLAKKREIVYCTVVRRRKGQLVLQGTNARTPGLMSFHTSLSALAERCRVRAESCLLLAKKRAPIGSHDQRTQKAAGRFCQSFDRRRPGKSVPISLTRPGTGAATQLLSVAGIRRTTLESIDPPLGNLQKQNGQETTSRHEWDADKAELVHILGRA